MTKLTRIAAALTAALALAVGGAATALAKNGADDPPGHHHGAHHHGKHHHKGQHHQADGPNHK